MNPSFSPTEQTLIDQGFRMIREYNPFGYAPCFAKGKEIRFVVGEKIMTCQEMYDSLQENWIPQAQKEVLWKLDSMKQYFML
jgi:hypothetical protein